VGYNNILKKIFCEEIKMTIRLRWPFDRRSGEDRRRITNRGYFRSGGDERRSWRERRSGKERRKDWLRV